jgi:hypothetical protein
VLRIELGSEATEVAGEARELGHGRPGAATLSSVVLFLTGSSGEC